MKHNPPPTAAEFLVVCLCAEWCATCRDYRDGFFAMQRDFADVGFHWLDVEDHADLLPDIDVENFPTLLILRQDSVLFYGPLLPHHVHLRRLLETLGQQSREESRSYATRTPERQGWQALASLRAALASD